MTATVSALAASADAIHQLVNELVAEVRRIAHDPEVVDRLTYKRLVANGKRVDRLFGQFLADLTALCDADTVNVATRYVPNIMELRLQPALRTAMAAVREIEGGQAPPDAVAAARALNATGLDEIGARIDRYVCAVAIRLGRPVAGTRRPA